MLGLCYALITNLSYSFYLFFGKVVEDFWVEWLYFVYLFCENKMFILDFTIKF